MPPPLALADRFDLEEDWFSLLAIAAVAVQAYSIWRVLPPLSPGTRPWLLDSLIFEYVGWFLTTGGRLYVDVWAIKPPLSFETTALLSLLSGGNVLVYHALAVFVTNAAVVGGVLLVGRLTHRLTDDPEASLAAGLAVFALPAFHWRAAFGFKAKYFVVLFGLLAVWLALSDRPLWAGLSAGAAVGYWQLAVVFPALALGIAARRSGRRAALRGAAGVSVAALLMLAPVVAWGAVDAMIAEAVLAPLLVTETQPVVDRLVVLIRVLGFAFPVVLLGIYGAGRGLLPDYRLDGWWIPAGGAWFALQVVVFDFDSFPDLFAWFPFLALGIGLLMGTTAGRRRGLLTVVALLALFNVATLGGVGTSLDQFHVNEPYRLRDPGLDRVEKPIMDPAVRQAVFWYTVPTDTCRVFMGRTQFRLVKLIDGEFDARRCGALGPAWNALIARWGVG